MILSKVKYNSNDGYELVYTCHGCGKEIPDNRFLYCPHCGVKFLKDGRPEKLKLDEGDICGLIALAIVHGGFERAGREGMKDGKFYKVEGPGRCGMVWAAWSKETRDKVQKERVAKETSEGGAA